MPPISLKKILIVILIILLLSRLDLIIAAVVGIFRIFYDCFEPLRRCSAMGKYVVASMFLALVWITIFKLLYRK